MSPIIDQQGNIFRSGPPEGILSATADDGAGWTCVMVVGVIT